jgi:hemerythrin
MPLVTWQPSYSVKVARYDDDHKRLFAMINDLHVAMLAGQGKEKIQQIVKQLGDYTKFHFSAEEAQLEKTNYPELSAHKAEHQLFIKQVQKFEQDIAAGKLNLSVSVAGFLNDWLANHIKKTDQKYSNYLNEHGVQ